MNDYLIALALAAIPAVGNFGGGVLAEVFNISKRILSLALHAAAGIVLAVIGVELMPEVLQAEPSWVVILAFLVGGAFAVGVDKAFDVIRARVPSQRANAGPWMIYFGVAVDLFSDGLMIGAGSTVSLGLGLLLALGQVAADIPEGFAIIATFKDQDTTRRQRLLIAASFAVPVLLGATVGYWVVRGRPELVKLALLSFTAAILVATAVEEIITEAHEKDEDTRLQEFVLIAGFALFMLLSLYFE